MSKGFVQVDVIPVDKKEQVEALADLQAAIIIRLDGSIMVPLGMDGCTATYIMRRAIHDMQKMVNLHDHTHHGAPLDPDIVLPSSGEGGKN